MRCRWSKRRLRSKSRPRPCGPDCFVPARSCARRWRATSTASRSTSSGSPGPGATAPSPACWPGWPSSMASNPEVKKFGEQMVTDHTGVNKQAVDLVTKLKVTPKDNPTSTSLKEGGAANVASLKKLNGAAFDKAYIDHEVAYHQQVL